VTGRQTDTSFVGSIGMLMNSPPLSRPTTRYNPRLPFLLGTTTCRLPSTCVTCLALSRCRANFASFMSSITNTKIRGIDKRPSFYYIL